MKRDLKHQDWLRSPALHAVFAALDGQARCVGGCVRDGLLGLPVQDIDLATPLPPEMVMEKLAAAGLKAVPTGLAHGTVTAVADRRPFEITTLRADVETFGRHARVEFVTDWAADARRRDFTLNALYCDLAGHVFDPVGGLDDLVARRVRFIGDARDRIREDGLRILRFFRFSARFSGGMLDRDGLSACVDLRDMLANLSAERVRGEVLKILVAEQAVPVLWAMFDRAILPWVLPEAADFSKLDRLCAIETGLGLADPVRRLASLAAPGSASAIAARLKFSNAERDRLIDLDQMIPLPGELAGAELRAAIYRLGTARFIDHTLLNWAVDGQDRRALYDAALTWEVPKFPLGGKDILALGVSPGPAVKVLLAHAEARWIAGDFTAGRDELLAWLAESAAEQTRGD